jgi:bifunctional UDP-N-acetylglucosamine pyrophosphorylase/glucosamine-1-phosphate N-acetyltransferase
MPRKPRPAVMNNEVAAVILAAGRGTRMKSQRPKVLFEVCGRSMLAHAIQAARGLNPRSVAVVVGHGREEVRKAFEHEPNLEFVVQDPPRGTGDAVKVAMRSVPATADVVLVTYGDMPCLTTETLQKLVNGMPPGGVALLTVTREEAHGFGRILRDPDGGFIGIREEKDCSPEERAIREVNVGVYAFDRDALARALPRVQPNNAQREYYLTDAVLEIAKHGGLVRVVEIEDETESMGVNSLSELAMARNIWQERILDFHLANGVFIEDPATTIIDVDVEIGAGTTVRPFTVLRRGVRIGSNCEIGPFAHLRMGAEMMELSKVGNFVEVKKSRLGRGVKAMHLAYLGDTTIGENANIGAGTITANYDGKNKYNTVIGARAFIGSGTVLVAPSTVGDDAVTGAGAIVTKKTIPGGDVWIGVPARPIAHAAGAGAATAKTTKTGKSAAARKRTRTVKTRSVPSRPANSRSAQSQKVHRGRG